MKGKKLALFDFDGTLTNADSFLEFIKFSKGSFRFYLGLLLLSPFLVFYKLGLLSNYKAKLLVCKYFFNRQDISQLRKQAIAFGELVIPRILRKGALESIQNYQTNGFDVCLVSASLELYLKPWCELHGINCLATQMKIKHAMFIAEYHSKNCFGIEKAHRVKAAYNLSEYIQIDAYGDTKGDYEMLALAHNQFYKPFRNS